ncbi:MAG: glucose dehydrogenase, partial [Candidatus Aminicenantales bacterium]
MAPQSSWEIREGFQVENVVGTPSPLFYVTELYGSIKVVTGDFQVRTFAENLLNYEPDFRMPGTGESGVIGVAVRENSEVYASMIYREG